MSENIRQPSYARLQWKCLIENQEKKTNEHWGIESHSQ